MSQGAVIVPTTPPLTGVALVNDINTALGALSSMNAGASAPTLGPGASSALAAGQLWLDTSTAPRVIKIYDSASWVTVGSLDATAHTFNVGVAQGGTGAATLTSHGVLIGHGTSAVAALAAAAAGTLLGGLGASSDPAFTPTPTLGIAGTTLGTLSLTGNTSGTVLITPQAAAGTPTLTLPNASGTFAVNGNGLTVIDATTGVVSLSGGYVGGAWSSWTPTFVAGTPGVTPPTPGTCTGQYIQIGKLVIFRMELIITTNGTGAGWIRSTLPVNAATAPRMPFAGLAYQLSSKMLVGEVTGANQCDIFNYDATYPGATGEKMILGGCYEAA